jgi:hypothetical protein
MSVPSNLDFSSAPAEQPAGEPGALPEGQPSQQIEQQPEAQPQLDPHFVALSERLEAQAAENRQIIGTLLQMVQQGQQPQQQQAQPLNLSEIIAQAKFELPDPAVDLEGFNQALPKVIGTNVGVAVDQYINAVLSQKLSPFNELLTAHQQQVQEQQLLREVRASFPELAGKTDEQVRSALQNVFGGPQNRFQAVRGALFEQLGIKPTQQQQQRPLNAPANNGDVLPQGITQAELSAAKAEYQKLKSNPYELQVATATPEGMDRVERIFALAQKHQW